ncbi:DUF4376 domain-containing protein [Brevundimonas guildfordensis]|uniref:DUF4376 domain-containing protein n=1 Tax=Brevundimonas guildfordensis TaxID=2762241 RepID=A0ABR8R1A7_9CAUL|nr:hypothetical protein [Brevundimonas guildfordensis]MBD7941569.1 hypothetical protein [Brevundimonas guildfordensis]
MQYPPDWPHDDLVALGLEWVEPEPPALTADDICRQIDAERDRRTALDFAYDFGETPAVDDSGGEIAAGERLLQMRPEDQRNWQALQGAALTAVVSGAPETVLPMRAEDNWNIQTTAAQVLQVLAAMTAHASALLLHGGALKSQVRAAADPASVDWMTGWPGDV